MTDQPTSFRLGAYAVVLRTEGRSERVLLSRIAARIAMEQPWTLPGGGVDRGEHPRDAVVREIYEETGLRATVGEQARVYSFVRPDGDGSLHHGVRLVFEGWVPADAPAPRVIEVDGSTDAAAWHDVGDVLAGRVPATAQVREALADHTATRHQRVAAYALVLGPGPETGPGTVLLVRVAAGDRHAGGVWTLPGGGIGHGEAPREALAREVAEECGTQVRVTGLLDVHDEHLTGTAPSGRREDFHGVHLIFTAEIEGAEPAATDDGGVDAVAWVPIADVEGGRIDVQPVVAHALQVAERTSHVPRRT